MIPPVLHEERCEDIEDDKYFVLIDESTDLAYIKGLHIAVRYYNKENKAFCVLFPSLHCPCGGDRIGLRCNFEQFGITGLC